MQAQFQTCSISSKKTLESKRDNYRKRIRRDQIDSIFKQTRSLLVSGNHNCQIEIQQNSQINYNVIIPFHNYLNLQHLYPPNHNLQPLYPNWPLKQPQISHKMQQIKPNINVTKQQQQRIDINKQNRNILTEGNGFSVFRKVIGQGTYSKVYEGQEISTKIKVAVKQIKELEENEIRCLTDCTCPYIVKMYTYWRQGKKTYLVLQMCDRNLREEMKYCSKNDLIKYFIQVLEGMNVLVKRRIIHRDVKFQNILIKDGVAKITDFGLAKPLGNQLSVQSLRCGTPYTMAPQILFHSNYSKPTYTLKCDIWSLGVLLHEILYERHPFDYSQQKMLRRKRVSVIKKFPVFDNFIDQALIFEQKQRMNWASVQSWIATVKNPQIQHIAVKQNIKYQIQNIVSVQNPQKKEPQIKFEPFKKKATPYLVYNGKYNQVNKKLKQNEQNILGDCSPKLIKNFINMGYFDGEKHKSGLEVIVQRKNQRPLRNLNVIPKKQVEQANKHQNLKKKQQFKTPQVNRNRNINKFYKVEQVESSASSSSSVSIYSKKDVVTTMAFSFQSVQKQRCTGIRTLAQFGMVFVASLILFCYIL